MHETVLIYKTLELHSIPWYRFSLDAFPLQMQACCCVAWNKNRKLKKRWVPAGPLWARNTRECSGGACSAAAVIFSALSFRFLTAYLQKTTYDTGLVTINSLWATKTKQQWQMDRKQGNHMINSVGEPSFAQSGSRQRSTTTWERSTSNYT
jgi:hypothetical protein